MNFIKKLFNKKENLSEKPVIHHNLLFDYSECRGLEYLLPILDARLNKKWTIEKRFNQICIRFDTSTHEEYLEIISELNEYCNAITIDIC